jgi:hypothetical protein
MKSAYHQMVLYCKTGHLNRIPQQLSEDYYTIETHHHARRFHALQAFWLSVPFGWISRGQIVMELRAHKCKKLVILEVTTGTPVDAALERAIHMFAMHAGRRDLQVDTEETPPVDIGGGRHKLSSPFVLLCV